MTDLTGSKLERYHLLERLGSGGMASVYRAYDLRLECEMAVKVIRREAFAPEVLARILQRFEREARVLAKLNHPNIVSVVDYGEFNGAPYLVMRFMPGGTLKDRLGQRVNFGEACRMLLPVARALAYAHQEGILHRDVKPSNILLSATGEPVLSDFGIARIVESGESHTLTGTGVGIGTPEYMAPEQGMGLAVDARADVYSLGIVLFELVTGCKPFTADTPIQLIFKQVNEPLPSPRQYNPELSDAAVAVIEKALAKKPEDRFQTMADLASEMDRVASGRPAVQEPKQAQPGATVLQKERARDEATRRPKPRQADQGHLPAPGLADMGPTRDDLPHTPRGVDTGSVQAAPKPSRPGVKIPGWTWAAVGLSVVVLAVIGVALVLRTLEKVKPPDQAAILATATEALLLQSTPTAAASATLLPSQTPGKPTLTPTRSPAINTFYIGQLELVLENADYRAEKAVFSPDGKRIAAGSALGVYLLDGETLEQVGWIETKMKVSDLAFTPDGTLLATNTGDHTIKLWYVNTGELVRSLKGIEGMAAGLAISPDGDWLVVGDSMGGPKLWKLESGLLSAEIEGIEAWVDAAGFTQDSRTFALGTMGAGGYRVRASDAEVMWGRVIEEGDNFITSLAVSPTDGKVAFGSRDGKVYLWQSSDGSQEIILEGHTEQVSWLDYSDEGRWLVSGSFDRMVKIWEVANYTLARTLELPGRVTSVDFDSQTRKVLICTDDGSLHLWEIR